MFSAGTSSRKEYHGSRAGSFDLVCHHEALPHGAVGGLPEVAALGVFEMGAARDEGDLHIRQRRADEDAEVLLFFQMGQHEALPVLSSSSSRQLTANCIPLPRDSGSSFRCTSA